MLHHRAAYDSIEPGEVTSLTGNHEVQPLRRDGHLSKKKMIVASLFLLGVVALFASNQSLMLLAELPLIGKGFRKWNAQNLADDFRATYLSERQLHHQISSRRDQQAKFQAPDGCESTVVILRHCEKGRIREHCSYVGYERSVYLASIFGNDDERWPAPSYIYALRAGQRHNPEKKVYREMETILPLAIKSNVTVNDSYDTRHASSLAQEVSLMLRSGEMCGKVVVICWKHSNIPHLAHKLGCGPEQGCPADYPSYTFDQAWQIKVRYYVVVPPTHD